MNFAQLGILLICYLIGAIPFGLFVARWFGKIDIRKVGSGNIGATNVGRIMGFRWFMVVFLLDAAKGFVPTLLATAYATDGFQHSGTTGLPVLGGLVAILGHMFPCWLKFRGGKGVATALGVVMVLAPWSSLAAALIFGASFLIWRMVSLSSILGALLFMVLQMWLLKPSPWADGVWPLGLFSVVVPLLIIVRHRSNIRRLLRGEEHAFRKTMNSPPPAETSGK